MQKYKLPKKPNRPKIPYRPIKSVILKNILLEQEGAFNQKTKTFKLDLKVYDLLESLPSTIDDENLHIMVESLEEGSDNFILTLYATEPVKNQTYLQEKNKYNKDMQEYKEKEAAWNKERKARKAAIKDIIENESKPRRKDIESEDNDSGLKISVKNRDVK
jgi:hypothetical protein